MAASCAAVIILALALLPGAPANPLVDTEVEAALHYDDQCESADADVCAVNALQLKASARMEAKVEATDIRLAFFKAYSSSFHALKPHIASLYRDVFALERQVILYDHIYVYIYIYII